MAKHAANFTHKDGNDYDIQYVQVGCSITHTIYPPVTACMPFVGWTIFNAIMLDRDYFKGALIYSHHGN